MIRIESRVFIGLPPEEVFSYIANFENNPKWQSGMQEANFTSEGPLAIGSTYAQKARFLGRQIDSTFEVVDFEPGRLVKITSTSGSFPITVTRVVEAAEGGSEVSAIVEGDASGFFKIAQPLMRRMVQRSVDQDYARLKGVLESSNH